MHRGIFKRAGCVLLIAVLCFGLAAPAFALTFVPSRADATDISQRINTANITWAQAYGYYVGGPATAPNFNATAEIFDGYFISDFPTGDYSSYVFVSMDQLVELSSKCDFPVTLTFLPTLGIYIIIFDAEFGTSSSEGQREMALSEFSNLSNSALIYQSLPSSSTAVFPYRIVAAFAPNSQEDIPSDLNSSSSGTTDRSYYTDNSSSDTTINVDGSQTVTNIYQGGDTFQTDTFDYSNGTWYDNVSGTINNIETLKYNPVSNTYTINNTYNITYEYNYTYYYNLGSSENLVQDYKFYYELPDGRSSSDLTADEIAGLSLEFDVVNYAQDRTDENTKILVPFDGSWEDTAYNGPDLLWKNGASVTYKESAAFEGALYLDGSVSHSFGFDGFFNATPFKGQGLTLQFRHYLDAFQSDSSGTIPLVFTPIGFYSSSGSTTGHPTFYLWNGSLYYYRGNVNVSNASNVGTFICRIPSGVWTDYTFTYFSTGNDATYIHIYVNGVFQRQIMLTDTASNTFVRTCYPFFGFNVSSFSVPSSLNFDDGSFSAYFRQFSASGSPQGAGYQMIDNLRLVDFALYDGLSNFVPTPVPFDTNLVYVLPDTTNLKDNTIAVQSGVPVSGYRIGGVRPTFPDAGMVWMPLENDKIADCQIYNGSYWESVGCRVWTGERWVPAWAFNVITLSDLWDMYGGEDSDNYTEITPGSFYQWFQQQFLELKTTITNGFDRILQALGVQTDDTDVTEPDADGNSNFTFFQFFDNLFSTQQKEESGVVRDALDDLLDLAKRFLRSIRDFFSGFAVMEGLGSDYLQAASDALSGVSELVSGVWLAIPSSIQNVLVACFMLVVFGVLVAIFV